MHLLDCDRILLGATVREIATKKLLSFFLLDTLFFGVGLLAMTGYFYCREQGMACCHFESQGEFLTNQQNIITFNHPPINQRATQLRPINRAK